MMIWATYMAGNFWLAGIGYQGVFYTIWWDYMVLRSCADFFEAYFESERGDDEYRWAVIETWMEGPLRRISASLGIYFIGNYVTTIPGINFLSLLVGWWAVLDFYDYKIDPMVVGIVHNDYKWAGKSLELALQEASSG